MNKPPRAVLRAAVLIHEQLAEHDQSASTVHLPNRSWAMINHVRQRIAQARDHGWQRAAKKLRQEMTDHLGYYRLELDSMLRALETRSAPRVRYGPCDIYQDLLALSTEFDDVEIDLDEHELRVTTDAIVLEGIHLGRFTICLDWQKLGDPDPAYRVMACDPHPARTREDVPHPHVQDETLCEGEGRAAIRAALAQGRVQDFVVLVSQVLHTYARGSAYVELDDWNGTTCSDCGDTMSAHDSYGCQRCGSDLCEDCRRFCAVCDEPFCADCFYTCPECEADICRGCMEVCPSCGRRICARCLEHGLCPSCQESPSPDNEEDHDEDLHSSDQVPERPARTGTQTHAQSIRQTDRLADATEDLPDPAAEPDRLGQALVPA